MVSVRQLAVLFAVAVLSCNFSTSPEIFKDRSIDNAHAEASSLFAQSAAQLFLSEFNHPNLSFLLLDAKNGSLLAVRWSDAEKPIPMGSLVKPFTALAYGSKHDFRYPTYICKGETSGCWRPAGHGATDIVAAIANSCNSYFRALTKGMTGEDVDATAREFGIDEPTPTLHDAALTGLGGEWRIAPILMARAYLELSQRKQEPGVSAILAGMQQSAQTGTGQEVGRALRYSSALVKTGTAQCTHQPRAPGDGFAVVLFPEQQPEIVLLVRVHGVPGAQAAATAGRMIRRIEN